MKEILSIFRFTFSTQAKKKSFIVTTIILYLVIIVALCIPAIINSFSSSGGSSESSDTIYIIDNDNIVSDNFETFSGELKGYNVVQKQSNDKDSIIDSIKENDNENLVVLRLENGAPFFDLYVKSITSSLDPDEIGAAIKKAYGEKVLSQSGVSKDVIASAYADVTYSSNFIGGSSAGGMVAGVVVVVLLFMAIYMYGYWVAMSIASEKSSRVMEVLITSTKPSRIIIGKSLGMGILGLCQMIGLIIVGAIAYSIAYPKDFTIGNVPLDLSCFTPFSILMIIIFFIVGYALYAMMYAVCGATVSKSEDIQQAVMPVTLIGVISFYFAYTALLTSPDNSATVAASIIPFTAPFTMPSRILEASVPAWHIVLSLVLLILTTVLMTYISIKLYSSAVLHYGKRLKISELIKMSRSKN